MSRQLALFFTAAQFLTRLPTPVVRDFDSSSLSQSVRYFPLVGILVGLINVGVWWVSNRWLPASVSIGIMLAASAAVTGALHEDGFADACDGFGGGSTPDRVLAIMKDSRIGAYGAIGVFLMLGLKWTALAALPLTVLPLIVVAAHAMSRWCSVALIWRLAYVRGDDDAKSKPFAGRLGGAAWILGGLIGVAGFAPLAAAWARWSGDAALSAGGAAASGAAASSGATALGAGAVAAALATLLAGGYFRRRIGGYTGDCLGAAQQLAELAFLLGGLAAIQRR
ncbi:MAG: adenosylcobinamide-GDP ribazoletransferase [Steroidobacteraceae bacterium]